jgi:hypothetical protein
MDMKTAMMIRAGFALLSLTAAVAPAADAANWGRPDPTHRSGPYDNTGKGPQTYGAEGGGG